MQSIKLEFYMWKTLLFFFVLITTHTLCYGQIDTMLPSIGVNDFKITKAWPNDSIVIIGKYGSIGFSGKSEMFLKYRFLVFHKTIQDFTIDECRSFSNVKILKSSMYSYTGDKILSKTIKSNLNVTHLKITEPIPKDSVFIFEFDIMVQNKDDYYPFYLQSFYPTMGIQLKTNANQMAYIHQVNQVQFASLKKNTNTILSDTITSISIKQNDPYLTYTFCHFPKDYYEKLTLKYISKKTLKWAEIASQKMLEVAKIDDSKYIKDIDFKKTCSKNSNDIQKAKNIYQWIHLNYGSFSTLKPKLSNPILVQLFYKLLIKANIEASIVITSPKKSGKLDSLQANFDDLQTIFCSFKIENRVLFTDMTNAYFPIGQINENFAEVIGFDCKSQKFVTIKNKNKVMIFSDLKCQIEGNSLVTNAQFTIYGNKAAIIRELIAKQEELTKDNLFKSFGKITDLKVENKDSFDLPLKLKFKTVSTNCISFNDSYINIFPLFFFRTRDNPYTEYARSFIPVEYDNVFELYTSIEIPIPKDYITSSIPRSLNNKLSNGNISFDYAWEKHENVFKLNTSYTINKYAIDGFFYQELKNFYQKLIMHESEPLIFARKY